MEASAVVMMIFGIVFLWGGFGICLIKAMKNK
jgi:hypothetical protein